MKTKPLIIEEVLALQEQGKTAEALELINPILEEVEDKDLLGEKAWCHYRRKEYPECRDAIRRAGGDAPGGNRRARECLAQLAAYVDKDDALLAEIADELPDSVSVQSALVVRMRDNGKDVPLAGVMAIVIRFLDYPEIAATNLINNAGRLFHMKSEGEGDFFTAIGLLELALVRYGEGKKNLHHRAAVLFWQSKIMERLSGKEAARAPARGSYYLWERQIELDPTNPAYLKGFEGAKARLTELGCEIPRPT